MRIGVFGMGVVGKAVFDFVKKTETHPTYGYDKFNDDYKWDAKEVKKLDIIFLCLPTPTKEEDGKHFQDLAPIRECIEMASKINKNVTFILKSTVMPGTTDWFAEEFNAEIVHNPEFLSELTAVKDFEEQDTIVLGFCKHSNIKKTTFVKWYVDLFRTRNSFLPAYFTTDAKSSEMIKYTANCFYATKVAFFNSINEECKKLGISYNTVASGAIYSNHWINEMHTKVPGRHGPGYSGMCFPKDMKAMSMTNPFLALVDEYNEDLRSSDLQKKAIHDIMR